MESGRILYIGRIVRGPISHVDELVCSELESGQNFIGRVVRGRVSFVDEFGMWPNWLYGRVEKRPSCPRPSCPVSIYFKCA